MNSTKDTKPGGMQSAFSRRNLLKGATALTAAASLPQAFGQQPTGAPRGTVWLYIGTYTGAPGSGGNGQGIYLCELNLSTGELTVLKLVAAAPPTGTTPRSPSTIALARCLSAAVRVRRTPVACRSEFVSIARTLVWLLE
jgi:6-phosphogluconolactonase